MKKNISYNFILYIVPKSIIFYEHIECWCLSKWNAENLKFKSQKQIEFFYNFFIDFCVHVQVIFYGWYLLFEFVNWILVSRGIDEWYCNMAQLFFRLGFVLLPLIHYRHSVDWIFSVSKCWVFSVRYTKFFISIFFFKLKFNWWCKFWIC